MGKTKQPKWEAVLDGRVIGTTWAYSEFGARQQLDIKLANVGDDEYLDWVLAGKPVRQA